MLHFTKAECYYNLGMEADDEEFDKDGDGYYSYDDNCPDKFNENQVDSDNDGLGNVCDPTPYPIVKPPFIWRP